MDPASHVLFGGTLAIATRRPRAAGLAATFILGSLAPDIDILLTTTGFDRYLQAHVSGTHALLASVVEALVLAAAMRGLFRNSRFVPLYVAAWLGAMGHIFWDLADSSDLAIFAPFSTRIYGWHLVAMWEPVVLVVMATALVIAWRRPVRARMAAVAALLALAVILGAKAVSKMAARRFYEQAVAADSSAASARYVPVLSRLFEWTVYDRSGDRVRAWRVNSLEARVSLAFERQDAPPTGAVLASKRLPVVQRFLSLEGLPFVRVERNGNALVVLWSDARMCSATGCTISFGGAFDEGMTPLYQVIQIGGIRQVRAISRN